MGNALVIKLEGKVISNNLAEYKKGVLSLVKEWERPLTTPEDFADAKKAVKVFKEAEDAIKLAERNALDSTADIKKLFDDLRDVRETLRPCRLELNRKVKAEEDRIKQIAISGAIDRVKSFVEKQSKDCPEIASVFKVDRQAIEMAAKGKRTQKTIESALKKAIDAEADRLFYTAQYVERNLADLNRAIENNPALFFPDKIELLSIEHADTFRKVLDERIERHVIAQDRKEMQAVIDEQVAMDRKDAVAMDHNDLPVDDMQVNKVTGEVTQAKPAPTYAIFIKLNCDKERAVEITEGIAAKYSSMPEVEEFRLTVV